MGQHLTKGSSYLRFRAFADRVALRLGLLGTQDWNGLDVVFVVSTGRTGTKFFSRFFSGVDGLHAVHEPRPNILNYALEYAQGRNSHADAVKFLELSRRTAAVDTRRRGCSLYLESNNRFYSLLKPLREVFPQAKIIHVVRDGRDYVKSGMARRWYTDKDYKPREKATMFPDDPYCDKWDQMSRFEKICWRWQKKDGFIADDFDDLDGPKLRVKFEDIFKDQERIGLYEITRFLAIDDKVTAGLVESMGDERVNENRAFVEKIDSWSDWNEDLKESFDGIAAHYMKRHYDYTPMSSGKPGDE